MQIVITKKKWIRCYFTVAGCKAKIIFIDQPEVVEFIADNNFLALTEEPELTVVNDIISNCNRGYRESRSLNERP